MRFLLSPKWVTGHILILALGVTFVTLGFWQLDRWSERRLSNSINAARYQAAPTPLLELLTGAGDDVASLEYRRAIVTGEFAPGEEVLLRSKVRDTRAGFDVITPLVLAGDDVVLVDRGWVPLEFDTVPVVAASPPSGETTTEGLVRLTEPRTGGGHDDFARGAAVTISRVDIPALDPQISGTLLPVYIELIGEVGPTVLPVPSLSPDFTDEGPHRDYALQWFGFALVAVLGYGLLIRRALRRRRI